MPTGKFKIKKKTFIFLVGFSILLIGIGTAILNSSDHVQHNVFVLGTFYINIAICFIFLIKSVKEHPFSFDMMFWLFGLFFFGFAPALQYFTNYYAWNLQPKEQEVLITNLYIFFWLMCYLMGRNIKAKFRVGNGRTCKPGNNLTVKYRIDNTAMNILLILSILITLYYVKVVGFSNLFARSTNANENLDKGMALLVHHGFHNTVLFTMVLSILQARQRKGIGYEQVIAGLCFIISCFPTGIARNMMASFYGGLLIIFMTKGREKRWFSFAIIGGIVLVFPAINIFRNYATLISVDSAEYIKNQIQNTYLSGDYDAHQMFISIQRWGAQDGLRYGRQLIGALLFFVPRSVWMAKPYGTGQSAFEALHQHWYTNVSAPLVAEGWINFGIIGIAVFGLITGYIANQLDKKYWHETDNLSRIRVIYPFSMFMFFFMQRGDMMATWSYTTAQVVVGMVIYKFAVKKSVIARNEHLKEESE